MILRWFVLIELGLTTWSEHQTFINENRPVTLEEYAAHLPLVEVDTFFYGLPRASTVASWLSQVPPGFSFIPKVPKALTRHPGEQLAGLELKQAFSAFRQSVDSLVATNHLKTVLVQFPPTFTATKENVAYLRYFRSLLADLPLALELRHQSWYAPGVTDSLLRFCQQYQYSLVAADEPTNTQASVPFVLAATNPKLAVVRLHGRNARGWANQGADWRKKRTLYSYSQQELAWLKEQVLRIEAQVEEVVVIFNNNSAGDAAPNALAFKEMLGLEFSGLGKMPPEQLDLL